MNTQPTHDPLALEDALSDVEGIAMILRHLGGYPDGTHPGLPPKALYVLGSLLGDAYERAAAQFDASMTELRKAKGAQP